MIARIMLQGLHSILLKTKIWE